MTQVAFIIPVLSCSVQCFVYLFFKGGLSLEPRVIFPYIHESRNFLEQLLVTMNV